MLKKKFSNLIGLCKESLIVFLFFFIQDTIRGRAFKLGYVSMFSNLIGLYRESLSFLFFQDTIKGRAFELDYISQTLWEKNLQIWYVSEVRLIVESSLTWLPMFLMG